MAAKLKAGALRALPRSCGSSPQCRSLSRPSCNAGAGLSQTRQASSFTTPKTSRHGPPRAIASSSLAIARSRGSRRNYATGPPRNIAVLGGGMTGLTTAYYLTKFVPEAKITLYEASGRLGGWVDTEKVDVLNQEGEKATVLFDRGARTVQAQHSQHKWDDMVLYELIDALNLKSRLVTTPRGMRIPRYIYYPDHLVDVTGPYLEPLRDPLGTVASLLEYGRNYLTEPLYDGLLPSILNASFSKSGALTREQTSPGDIPVVGQQDLSVGEYFLRKFGRRDLIDNILSAIVHGTQGGDVWKLSIESSMFQRMMVQDSLGSTPGTVLALLDDVNLLDDIAKNNEAVRKLAEESTNWGYISFEGGFSTLMDAMAAELERNPNVTVLLNEPVEHLRKHQTQRIEITTAKSREPAHYDKVVSTIFAKTLASLTDNLLPSLAEMHAVTIQVVNLWYPTPNLNAPYHGFGYLIPQSVPAANNPEAALGVLFDSDREGAQSAPEPASGPGGTPPPSPGGTKLTVMLGGHHWDGLPDSFLPTGPSAAIAAVTRHLGIPALSSPAASSSKLCRACIPQHRVGHAARLAAAHADLLSSFGGRLAVAGGSYSSPGVLPGLRAARDVAAQVGGRFRVPASSSSSSAPAVVGEHPWSVGETGLAGLTGRLWSRWPRGQLPYVGGAPWRALRPGDGGVGVGGE